MTRALVTGSTGFLGSNLVAALNQKGIEVVGLRRSTSPDDAIEDLDIRFVVGDLMDTDSLQEAMQGVDWVFHVAAISDYWRVSKEVIYQVNVEGTRNMLQAALDAGVKRFVYTGSAAALGIPDPPDHLMDESDRFNLKPDDFPYGHSKQLAEDIVQEFAEKGLAVVSLLPSAIVGPRDLKVNVGELIIQALKPTLPFAPFPDGGLNYLDVRDCVDAHIVAAERGEVGARYVLAGNNLTHKETIRITNEVLGSSLGVLHLPRWLLPMVGMIVAVLSRLGADLPIDQGRVMLSGKYMYYKNAKAIRDLGLTTRPFAESIRDTYLWYAENGYLEKLGLPVAPAFSD